MTRLSFMVLILPSDVTKSGNGKQRLATLRKYRASDVTCQAEHKPLSDSKSSDAARRVGSLEGRSASLLPGACLTLKTITSVGRGGARRRPRTRTTGSHDFGITMFTLLDVCVPSLRRGHANLLSTVPILMDEPRRESP